MAESPCLTCDEEYNVMVEAQAKRKADVRAYHDALIAQPKADEKPVKKTKAKTS
jgi:hypothetical protein